MLKTIAGLQGVTVLSRDAQKKVNGGTGTCAVYMPADWQPNHTFTYSGGDWTHNPDGSNTLEGLSRSEVDHFMASGGRWCCASCGTVSWL